MKKYVGDFNTILYPEANEPKDICRLGQGEKCCPFLVLRENGFECWHMNYPSNSSIHHRLGKGTMNAKGDTCDWDLIADKAEEKE